MTEVHGRALSVLIANDLGVCTLSLSSCRRAVCDWHDSRILLCLLPSVVNLLDMRFSVGGASVITPG
jgi:hypothetical protein